MVTGCQVVQALGIVRVVLAQGGPADRQSFLVKRHGLPGVVGGKGQIAKEYRDVAVYRLVVTNSTLQVDKFMHRYDLRDPLHLPYMAQWITSIATMCRSCSLTRFMEVVMCFM